MNEVTFADSRMLWWLLGPAALLLVWLWQASVRFVQLRRLARFHTVPVRQRFRPFGDLPFWLALILSSAAFIVATARPLARTTMPQRAGLDVIVLQDASASMSVGDVARASIEGPPIRNRWQRSMRFLRELGDALSWNEDRVAMVAFAHIASPQIRLTRDPNTLFFFLDHLYARAPFRLEDDTTWDTNLEEAVGWGRRVVEKDEELHGRSNNAAVFVMLSDGEAWSGEVAQAIARIVERGIPLHVIGVGTLGGGPLPVVRTAAGEVLDSPGVSRLERASLQRIAAAGNGRYFEIDREPDRHIASTIVAESRRLAPAIELQQTSEELYWWFIAGGSALALAGALFVTRRAELALLLLGTLSAILVLVPWLW
jgi:Ca-activated chloride channel family protein